MKKKTSNQTKYPTCDFCDKAAKYESVKTVEPGPFAILYHVDGKDIGLIKVDPQKCHMVHYCEDHVPKLESKKILWIKDYAGEWDPKKELQNDILIKQELDRAAKTIGKKTGAVLTIEHDYEIGKMGIEPGDMQPIIEAIRKIYRNASVIVIEDNQTIHDIGIDPAYIKPVKTAIVDIDKQVSAVLKQRGQDTKRRPRKVQPKMQNSFIVRHGDRIVKSFDVCRESIKPIFDAIFDMSRPVTIKMQHGDQVVLSSVNPSDMKQVMDAIIEICSRK